MPPKRGITPAEEVTFKKELVAAIPHLRAFARSLCNDPTQADDLAQEALAKAWKARDSFEPGTSISGNVNPFNMQIAFAVDPAPVPEPGTLVLFGTGAALLAARLRRRAKV